MVSAASHPTLAKNARMGHPHFVLGKEEQRIIQGSASPVIVPDLIMSTLLPNPLPQTQVKTRTESDSMGQIEVPANVYWGAQTQRSLLHFNIGRDIMPPELIRAFGILKKACALVNQDLGKLPADKAKLIGEPRDRRNVLLEISSWAETLTLAFGNNGELHAEGVHSTGSQKML